LIFIQKPSKPLDQSESSAKYTQETELQYLLKTDKLQHRNMKPYNACEMLHSPLKSKVTQRTIMKKSRNTIDRELHPTTHPYRDTG